jgi:pimeloyl-ACP methyl ester carboxylesterase
MLVDLVQVTTTDGVRLHGALELPPVEKAATGTGNTVVDVWLCLHGTGSNFYAASTLGGLAPKLLATGAAVLRGNTRGHDIISTGPSTAGQALLGSAFERVDESPLDVRAWVELLGDRGFGRIGLLGHSMGAIKAILAVAADDPPAVVALAALSPPRLSYAAFCESPAAEEFLKTYAAAESLLHEGRGDELMLVRLPLPTYISAAGYLDRYGPQEKYNVLRYLGRVSCPTLVTYGSSEVQANVAFRGMPEAVEAQATPANRMRVAVIAGADHIYSGCHDSLAAVIERWGSRERMKGEG